jgi:hypothetical protein
MATSPKRFWDRTYRLGDDGERIEGTWRPAFIKNGDTYFLTDLKIYADGLIDCWGLVDIDGFREKVRSGWVATSLSEGGRASAQVAEGIGSAGFSRWSAPNSGCARGQARSGRLHA